MCSRGCPTSSCAGCTTCGPSWSANAARHARLAAAMPEAIDRMDEALDWLMWLEPEERRLVWLRAEGLPWKRITHSACHRPDDCVAALDDRSA